MLPTHGCKRRRRRRTKKEKRRRDHSQERKKLKTCSWRKVQTQVWTNKNDDFLRLGWRNDAAGHHPLKEHPHECPLCCNRYNKLKLLGKGSFGETWLARDLKHTGTSIRDQVALKIIRVSDMQELNMALDECTFLRAVNHGHIVSLHSFAHKSLMD